MGYFQIQEELMEENGRCGDVDQTRGAFVRLLAQECSRLRGLLDGEPDETDRVVYTRGLAEVVRVRNAISGRDYDPSECIECGERIDPARRRALPFTCWCTDCRSNIVDPEVNLQAARERGKREALLARLR